jgi:hypothetical protein
MRMDMDMGMGMGMGMGKGMDMDMAAWPHGRVVELSTFDRYLACGGDGVHSGVRSGAP